MRTCWRLYHQGYSLTEIAAKVNERHRATVTVRRVYDILARAHRQWAKRVGSRTAEEVRQLELAKLDVLEHEYWEAWFRSVALQSVQVKLDTVGDAVAERAEELVEEPALQRVRWQRLGARWQAATTRGQVERVSRRWTESAGDKRYLEGVQWCMERRAKYLGLDAPARSAVEVDVRQVAWELAQQYGLDPELVVDEVVRDAERILREGR
jgi:hypothetical protein